MSHGFCSTFNCGTGLKLWQVFSPLAHSKPQFSFMSERWSLKSALFPPLSKYVPRSGHRTCSCRLCSMALWLLLSRNFSLSPTTATAERRGVLFLLPPSKPNRIEEEETKRVFYLLLHCILCWEFIVEQGDYRKIGVLYFNWAELVRANNWQSGCVTCYPSQGLAMQTNRSCNSQCR